MAPEKCEEPVDLSVVIPSYNSATWLPSTLNALTRALAKASGLRAEVIIVDDGSTDDTREVLAGLESASPYPLRVIHQANAGRFLARWAGANAALSPTMLLLDSRVLIHEDALAFHFSEAPRATVRNANVVLEPSAPLVGMFWEVPTYLFWGRYLANRRPTTITPSNFDRVPKGTTCLLLPTRLFTTSCQATWPVGDPRLTSDDTRLLRHIVGVTPLQLDPRFSATYRARTTLRGFLRHSFSRGSLFVDSYWGTRVARTAALIVLAVAPPLLAGTLVALAGAGQWATFGGLAGAGLAALLAPTLVAAARGCGGRAVAAYVVLVVPFGVVFWAGLVRGVAHRRSRAKAKQDGRAARQ